MRNNGMHRSGLPHGGAFPEEIQKLIDSGVAPLTNTDRDLLVTGRPYAERPRTTFLVAFAQTASETAAAGGIQSDIDWIATLNGGAALDLLAYGITDGGLGTATEDVAAQAGGFGAAVGPTDNRDTNMNSGGFVQYICSMQCCYNLYGMAARIGAPFSIEPAGGVLSSKPGVRARRPDLAQFRDEIEEMIADGLTFSAVPDVSRLGLTSGSNMSLSFRLAKLRDLLGPRHGVRGSGINVPELVPDALAFWKPLALCRSCDGGVDRLSFQLNAEFAGNGEALKKLTPGVPYDTLVDAFFVPVEVEFYGIDKTACGVPAPSSPQK